MIADDDRDDDSSHGKARRSQTRPTIQPTGQQHQYLNLLDKPELKLDGGGKTG